MESIKILIFSDWFTPAFKAGGPIRSVVNFIERFNDEYEIYVLTTDRDLGDANPFQHIKTNKWIRQDGFEAMYLSPDKLKYRFVKNIIKGLNPDKIYLNSMFSRFTIFSLISSLYTNKIVLAPRGMLRSSALSVKPIRKYLYLSILRLFNVDQYISFHSTSIEETKSIKQIFPTAPIIFEASNLPVAVSNVLLPHNKIKGELKMIFVGRSHPIKNLLFLLSCLENINGNCTLKIIITKEDEGYWQECMSVIKKLTHIQTNVLFDVPHYEVKEHLEWADLFVLPTQGENFGHAIFEALAVGCPVLISDQTPWRNLEKSMAGIDVPINLDQFKHAVERFLLMDKDAYQQFRKGSLAYAKLCYEQMNVGPLYKKLFEKTKISKFGH